MCRVCECARAQADCIRYVIRLLCFYNKIVRNDHFATSYDRFTVCAGK